ncbi:fibrillin-2 [Teleopsis dalmanni]|uniref:fibrillin-2 n=1 Tax=Teleopsis dalmanni TaxID=139649 RepID=UPI0018CE80D7|nr:fibrillin-2 [Teleopsis dalmanni]
MTRFLFLLAVVAATCSVSFARYEDCENPPQVQHATIEIEDDEDTIHAIYVCKPGYELQGTTDLMCNLDTDEWSGEPPTCVKSEISNEIDTESASEHQNKKKKQKDIPEDRSVSAQLAATLDMSCAQAKIKAPELQHGFVQKYDRRRKGEKVFLVAFYSCNDNFDFEDSSIKTLYCSERKWVGEIPVCVRLGEYNEEDEEEYDEYEAVDEEEEIDEDEEANGAVDADADGDFDNSVVPPPPPPPTVSVPGTEVVDEEETDNEISVEPVVVIPAVGTVDVQPTVVTPPVTDINIIVEPTKDPYTPRLLDNNCGTDNGGCEHKCERLLYPGENEPRLKCSCFEGFSLDPNDYAACHDIDECKTHNGGCEQICNNLPGSYQCACEQGLQIDTITGNTCKDINECELPEVKANCAGVCENTHGSYRCVPILNNKEEIEDDNEDDSKIVRTSEVPAVVTCPAGFELVAGGSGMQCVDIDECSDGISGCEHCVNTEGSFECSCPAGYELAEDEKTCIDINECEIVVEDEDDAEAVPYKACTQGCENTIGSFRCTCANNQHLLEDRRTCAPDTCQDLSSPSLNKTRCAYQCVDLPSGVYECVCPTGYQLGADLHSCDVVENGCAKAGGYESCVPGTCQSSEDNNGFTCICPPGYSNEIFSCKEIDECVTGTHKCSHDCINTIGSYRCICPGGYRFVNSSEHVCEDIDECQSKPDLCGSLNCVNLPGAFTCLCADGTEPNPETRACNVRDPCENNKCSHKCIIEENNYICICPDGMVLAEDGINCMYVDLCTTNNNGCEQNCLEDGICGCRKGYVLDNDGKSCKDVDECQESLAICHHLCVNEPGGYKCSCRSGYELLANGIECKDIDECAVGSANCTSKCTNFMGYYECSCDFGFELAADQNTCLDIDECKSGANDCSHECFNLDGGYECRCPHGYVLSENKATCLDANKCLSGDNDCSQVCKSKQGGFTCACHPGYVLQADGKTCILQNACPIGTLFDEVLLECVEIDECQINNGGCSHTCVKGTGCTCPNNSYLLTDGKTCQFSDACGINNGGCSHICSPTGDSYVCSCPQGSQLIDNKNCAATCPAGYKPKPGLPTECVDVDECVTPGICEFSCLNTNGSYVCICPVGYKIRDGRFCVDIDECEINNGGCIGGTCINHKGSYQCKCGVGERLSVDRKTCEPRTDLHDQCTPFVAPLNGEIHCTKYRHKKKFFYNTKCKVWCNKGYKLIGPAQRFCNATGVWDNYENQCLPSVCPRIPPPRYGVILPTSCTLGKTYMGERCRLQCHPGYLPIHKTTTVCTSNQQWSNNATLDCVLPTQGGRVDTPLFNAVLPPSTVLTSSTSTSSFINRPFIPQTPPQFNFGAAVGIQRPYIKCPRNTTVFLAKNEATAHIILQKPLTNLDFRYIESFPEWTKNLQAHLTAGTYVITFRGHDPVSGKRARCQTVINVRHAIAPKVSFCTPSFEVTLGTNQAFRSVVWEEPRFEDGQKKLYKSRLPGELFGVGVHTVYYEATNKEGLISRCEFKIHVKPAASTPAPVLPTLNLDFSRTSIPMSAPIMRAPLTNANFLSGHESYVHCPGKAPVKVTQTQSVTLPVGCILKNVRLSPMRRFMQPRLFGRLLPVARY